MTPAPPKPIEILLVEDNPADVDLARDLFRGVGVATELRAVPDGVEALAYLGREGAYARAPRPQLVILDFNMPRMDGRELLAAIKSDPKLRAIPVIVLTTSSAASDVARAYDLGAACFVTKPVDVDGLDRVARAIEDFWLRVARLPGNGLD